MKSNSQFPIANWLYFGDLDGDGIEEMLQINGPYLSIFNPDFEHRARFTHQFPHPIKRLMTGCFASGDKREQVIALLEDGSMQVFGLSPDRTVLWWWMTMASIVAPDEHYIVGDYDGDGTDEILVFNPHLGSVRMYQVGPSGAFELMSNFQRGNLDGIDLRGKQLLAGCFGSTLGRKDLIALDPHHRQLFRYASVTLEGGVVTFWWAFTTIGGLYETGDQVVVANLDGSRRDGILIRSKASGAYSMFRAEFDDGRLQGISNVLVGQLPIQAGVGMVFAAKVRDRAFRRETGGLRRDDILFFDEGSRQLIRTDARYDPSLRKRTFWWAYTTDRIFVGSNFIFDTRMTASQVNTLLERHRFAFFQISICGNLNDAEKNALITTYRKAIRHGIETRTGVNASAFLNGDQVFVNFNVLFPQGAMEIAQTLIHEMMHCAGFSHPNRQSTDRPFDGGAYYSSPPLRSEVCIAGFQSDVVPEETTRSGTAMQKLMVHLDHTHCEIHDGECINSKVSNLPQARHELKDTDLTAVLAEKMSTGVGKA
jgi:hypothetical protein